LVAALGLGVPWLTGKELVFEGGGIREWLLIRGRLIDRLGLIEPDRSDPPRYMASPQDGTAPESTVVQYVSRKPAPDIIAAYAQACIAQGLAAGRREDPPPGRSSAELYLTCDGKAGDVYVTAAPRASGSRVTVRVSSPLR
jgi:hypothetical protein